MKYVLLLAVVFFPLQGQTQSLKADCHTADNLLDHTSRNYQWGTPKWLTMMDSAIGLCPTSSKAWGNKGMIYMMRGDVATWYKYIDKAVEFDPLYFLGNRAWHRMRYLRDYEGALTDLLHQDTVANFYTIYVSDMHNYMLIGQCKEGMGDYEGALHYYNRGLEKQIKERGETWIGTYDYLIRGTLKFKMDNLEEALSDLDKQAAFYEQLADTYYYRGLVYRNLNQPDKAKEDFERAKELLNGKGFKRWDTQVVLLNEVFQSDIQDALNSLN